MPEYFLSCDSFVWAGKQKFRLLFMGKFTIIHVLLSMEF